MECYKSVKLDKDMYRVANKSFSEVLESYDSSSNYRESSLANIDAFQRQLKRFDIRVERNNSDEVEKFFRSAQTATLFPEYVLRAVKSGTDVVNTLNEIIAGKTKIDSMDYRAIYFEQDDEPTVIGEGSSIPSVNIKLKENLVTLKKTGRMLVVDYETIKNRKIEVFTIALKQIGYKIAEQQLKSAIDILINGDGNFKPDVKTISGGLKFEDLIDLWNGFTEYKMNTVLISPNMAKRMLGLKEIFNPYNGLKFELTGQVDTLMGARLLKSKFVPDDVIIALDKNFALEMVCCGDIQVDYDKLIDRQLKRSTITSTYGFTRICEDAVKILKFSE